MTGRSVQVGIRAFASFKDAIGVRDLVVEVPAGSTVYRLWETLLATYPRLQVLPEPAVFALNGARVEADAQLRHGDDLVLLPPFSGGLHRD